MGKLLIACPACEKFGRRYILGELVPTGHILIQRTHGANGQYRNFTIVGGNDFYLICDHCGQQVYFKKTERSLNGTAQMRFVWEQRVYRESLNGTAGTAQTYSGTN